jgi:hypothetical protein
MAKKHHSMKRRHRRSQRGGGVGDWFSSIGNKAKNLTSSVSSWFGSSSSSPSSSVPITPSPQTPPQTYSAMGGKRRRHTRKLGRHRKSKRRN